MSPLLYVCAQPCINIPGLQFLIENGSNVTIKDCKNNTPLHHAVYGESAEGIRLLCGKGAEINAVNNQGQTPLDIALLKRRKNTELIQLLIQLGAKRADELGAKPMPALVPG